MEKLFGDFKPVNAKEWKAQLEKDLKGVPFEDLIWQSSEGLSIQPYYTAEDLHCEYKPAFEHRDWQICVKPFTKSDADANKDLLRSLTGGANSVLIDLSGRSLDVLLNDVRLDFISSVFIGTAIELNQLAIYLQKNYQDNYPDLTLIPAALATRQDIEQHIKVLSSFNPKKTKACSLDTLVFHNQYCSAWYEVALAFAQFAEYHLIAGKDLPKTPVVIRAGVSADYFTQIAKFRAMRRLWELFKKEFALSQDLYIVAETSMTNKTVSDKYNNLLRTTVEAMAAVAGGCNEILVQDFEVLSGPHSPMAQRLAVNQQLILKDECYLDKIADVSCGSYFIESLTDALATKALDAIKDIEAQGGYFAALENGKIEKQMAAQAASHMQAFAEGKELSIGVNKFHNAKEKIELSDEDKKRLKNLSIVNPALRFELEHFFNLKHA